MLLFFILAVSCSTINFFYYNTIIIILFNGQFPDLLLFIFLLVVDSRDILYAFIKCFGAAIYQLVKKALCLIIWCCHLSISFMFKIIQFLSVRLFLCCHGYHTPITFTKQTLIDVSQIIKI